MKRNVWRAVLGAVCLGSLCAACTTRQEIRITGSLRNADGATLICYRSVGGMFNSETYDTLALQADSTFVLTLPGGEYECFNLALYGKKKLGTLLTKGGNIRVQLDGQSEQPMTILEGQDEKTTHVAEVMSQLYDDVFDIRTRQGDRW